MLEWRENTYWGEGAEPEIHMRTAQDFSGDVRFDLPKSALVRQVGERITVDIPFEALKELVAWYVHHEKTMALAEIAGDPNAILGINLE